MNLNYVVSLCTLFFITLSFTQKTEIKGLLHGVLGEKNKLQDQWLNQTSLGGKLLTINTLLFLNIS